MPPRRPKVEPKDEPDLDAEEAEETPKPKKKRAAPKPKKEVKDEPDEDDANDPDADETPKKRVRKSKKRTEPWTTEQGWTAIPPGLLTRSTCTSTSSKIAAFDLDDTLVSVKQKSGGGIPPMPKEPEDFKFFNDQVISTLQGYSKDGYKIAIFSNQGGVKSALDGLLGTRLQKRANLIIEELACPLTIMYATMSDEYRKPGSKMWDHFVEQHCNGQAPDLEDSFYVGDAAGRPGDFAATDKGFAQAAGLPFKTPEDVFGEGEKTAVDAGPNAEMAAAFQRLAQHMEETGANEFGIRATKKVAGIIAGWPTTITAGKELLSITGVGKSSVAKMDDFLATGTLSQLAEAGIKTDPVEAAKEAAAAEANNPAFAFA